MSEPQLKPRDHWAGRGAFVLAAIGSAVGLGNLWGFPYKVYTFGGGAFLIPYFLAMLVIGIPLLIMEFSVGHWAQQSPPGAFKKILGKYKWVGWWLTAAAFIIICYYAVILGYCVIYLAQSVAGFAHEALPWAGNDAGGATKHFFGMVDYDPDNPTFALGAPRLWVLVGTIAAWVLVYLCLFRGVKWVSKVVLITVPLPWIMLVILTVRGLTLDGAIQGLEFYLEPRWEKLAEAETWRWAFGQVFFSMSLGFAVMLSYASFLHRKSDLNNNAMIIGLGDLGTSFVSGLAVFSMLGGMAHAIQAAGGTAQVPDLVPSGTVGLSFIVFPFGLTQLPFAAFFATVFFIALLTLGIDSAFSIVEACLASVCDNTKWARAIVLPVICLVGLSIGVLYTCGGGGLSWVGLTDDMINGPFGILIIALAEALVVGWAWRGTFVKKIREHANERSDWKLYGWWEVTVKWVAPAFLAVLFVWSLSSLIHGEVDAYREAANAGTDYSLPWPLIGSSIVFIAVPLVCLIIARMHRKPEEKQTDPVKAKGVRAGLAYVLAVMAVGGVVIEWLQYKGWLEPSTEPYIADGALNGTAYVFLAVGFVVIFGGLAWCFWRAMIAAGGGDTEFPEPADEPSDSAML
jgi:NSS family neurotransmitter:Na+ symporter